MGRMFRETHPQCARELGPPLDVHSLVLIIVCFLTNALYLGDRDRWLFCPLAVVLGAWAAVFWALHSDWVSRLCRTANRPYLGSDVSIALLFPVENILGMPVLTCRQ